MITITAIDDCRFARVENPVEITCPPGILSRRIRRLSDLTEQQFDSEHRLMLAIIDEAILDLTLIGRTYLCRKTDPGDYDELHLLRSARHFFRPADPRFKHKYFARICQLLRIDEDHLIECLDVAGYLPELRINTITLPRLELKIVAEDLAAGYKAAVNRKPRTSEFLEEHSTPKTEGASNGV